MNFCSSSVILVFVFYFCALCSYVRLWFVMVCYGLLWFVMGRRGLLLSAGVDCWCRLWVWTSALVMLSLVVAFSVEGIGWSRALCTVVVLLRML